MVMELCCLCRDPVPSDHRRKKKLHGDSCWKAKAVLCNLCVVPVDSYVEMRDTRAVLCYTCEKKLNVIHTMEGKILSLKADVRDKLSVLQSSIVGAVGNRTRVTTDTATESQADNEELPVGPDPKQIRISQDRETQILSPCSSTSIAQTVTTSTKPAGPSPAVQVNCVGLGQNHAAIDI